MIFHSTSVAKPTRVVERFGSHATAAAAALRLNRSSGFGGHYGVHDVTRLSSEFRQELGLAHATKSRAYGKKAADKIGKTMGEFKRGTLKTSAGRKVTRRDQAVAIGIAQARRAGYKTPSDPRGHATMWKPEPSIDAKVRAYLTHMRPGTEIDGDGIARALRVDAQGAHHALQRAMKDGLAVSEDGWWFGPARTAGARMRHATRKAPAQLDKEIAAFMASPKLGDHAWERQWSELLTEKHSKARLPTLAEVARALRYVENEYRLDDGKIDGEQWAEGLAFGRYAGGAEDKRVAKAVMAQLSAAQWLQLAERANALSREQQEPPRYVA